jgi:hypothetical protein
MEWSFLRFMQLGSGAVRCCRSASRKPRISIFQGRARRTPLAQEDVRQSHDLLRWNRLSRSTSSRARRKMAIVEGVITHAGHIARVDNNQMTAAKRLARRGSASVSPWRFERLKRLGPTSKVATIRNLRHEQSFLTIADRTVRRK